MCVCVCVWIIDLASTAANDYDILASFSNHLQLNEEIDSASLSANRKANSFAPIY